MHNVPNFLLAASVVCLLIAIVWAQLQKVERARHRNVHPEKLVIDLEMDAAPALEALRQVQAEAERAIAKLDQVRRKADAAAIALPVREMTREVRSANGTVNRMTVKEPAHTQPASKKPARTKR